MRAKKSLCTKMGLSFLALYSKFHFYPEEIFLVSGGCVGPPNQPPPPPPPPPPLWVSSACCRGGEYTDRHTGIFRRHVLFFFCAVSLRPTASAVCSGALPLCCAGAWALRTPTLLPLCMLHAVV